MPEEDSHKLEALRLVEDEPVRSLKSDELQLLPYAHIVAGIAVGQLSGRIEGGLLRIKSLPHLLQLKNRSYPNFHRHG